MIGEYSKLLCQLQAAFSPLGFEPDIDEDFLAILKNKAKLEISLESDPASYPSFTLSITRPGYDEDIVIWIAMLAFERAFQRKHENPTFKNQLSFLHSEFERIFSDHGYLPEYEKLLNEN